MSIWTTSSLLDKAESRRDDVQWLTAAWASPATIVIDVSDDQRISWAQGHPEFHPPVGRFCPERNYLLGIAPGGAAVFAARAEPKAGAIPLRAVIDGLDGLELQIVFGAAALVAWHASAGFCASCGAATHPVLGGQARQCERCARELYPRTDPAVIVAITDEHDRLLLGRQPAWPSGRVSVFAGFVEAGESLEQAVHREIDEEVGLALGQIRYLGSQPWPFPRSLMAGFTARATASALRIDHGEIESAQWFARDELSEALQAGTVALPSPTSIAFRMIGLWRSELL